MFESELRDVSRLINDKADRRQWLSSTNRFIKINMENLDI